MVVRLQKVQRRGVQAGRTVEAGLLQQFVDAAVGALDHAVRLRAAAARGGVLLRWGKRPPSPVHRVADLTYQFFCVPLVRTVSP